MPTPAREPNVPILFVAFLCFAIWLFSRTGKEHPASNSEVQSPAADDSPANPQADLWSMNESREEDYCISQRPSIPDRDENDTRWRLQDLEVDHAIFLVEQTNVGCFLRFRAPQWIAVNAGVLEGDAQRVEARGTGRMQQAIDISGNDMDNCYLDETTAPLWAIRDEDKLFAEGHPTSTLAGRLQQHLSDTASLDKFVDAFDSQTDAGGASRQGLSADLHRAQTMRSEAIQANNEHDLSNALLAAADSELLYQYVHDELNCPKTQIAP
jgi:hypothetical protein